MNTCYRIELTSIKCQVPLDTLENIALLAAKFFSPPKFLGFPRSHRAFYAPCTPSLLSIIPFSSQVCLVCYVSSLASCVSRVMWLNMSCSLSYGPCTLHIFNRYWYLNQWISRCSAFSFSLQHWHSPSEFLIQANRVSVLSHPKRFSQSCIGYGGAFVWYHMMSLDSYSCYRCTKDSLSSLC